MDKIQDYKKNCIMNVFNLRETKVFDVMEAVLALLFRQSGGCRYEH